MPEHHFETLRPVDLYVEIGKGTVAGLAPSTPPSPRVEVERPRRRPTSASSRTAHRISVVAPQARGGFFGGDPRLDVTRRRPAGQHPGGPHRQRRHRRSRAPSASAQLRSGSGDIRLGTPQRSRARRDRLRVTSASATPAASCGSRAAPATSTVDHAEAALSVSTGSGDVAIGTGGRPHRRQDRLGRPRASPSRSPTSRSPPAAATCVVTAAQRGRVTAKGASGDVRLGVPAGAAGVDRRLDRVRLDPLRRCEGAGQPAGRPGPRRGPRPDRQRRRPAHPRLSARPSRTSTTAPRPHHDQHHDQHRETAMTDSYLFFETSSRRHLAQQHGRAAAPRHPAVAQRHRLASRLRRVADRLDG